MSRPDAVPLAVRAHHTAPRLSDVCEPRNGAYAGAALAIGIPGLPSAGATDSKPEQPRADTTFPVVDGEACQAVVEVQDRMRGSTAPDHSRRDPRQAGQEAARRPRRRLDYSLSQRSTNTRYAIDNAAHAKPSRCCSRTGRRSRTVDAREYLQAVKVAGTPLRARREVGGHRGASAHPAL
jgi:hypothetical protein